MAREDVKPDNYVKPAFTKKPVQPKYNYNDEQPKGIHPKKPGDNNCSNSSGLIFSKLATYSLENSEIPEKQRLHSCTH